MSTPTHICPACELQQFQGDGFCDQCGTALVLARYCEECGVLITHSKEFCRECGARVPPVPTASPPAPTAKPTPEPSSTPQWMKDPEPEPSRPTPQWMKDPEPEPAPPRRRKSAPVAKPPATPPPAPPMAPPNAPLQRRPTAEAVPMRSSLPAPYVPSTADNTRALVAGAVGIVASITLFSGGLIPLALMLFVVMFVVGGTRLRHATANAIGGFIDWLWEDPVLRRKLLGE